MSDYMVLYRCEEENCGIAFGVFEEGERPYPYCPKCGSDDTMDTAELYKGKVVPDDRDW